MVNHSTALVQSWHSRRFACCWYLVAQLKEVELCWDEGSIPLSSAPTFFLGGWWGWVVVLGKVLTF